MESRYKEALERIAGFHLYGETLTGDAKELAIEAGEYDEEDDEYTPSSDTECNFLTDAVETARESLKLVVGFDYQTNLLENVAAISGEMHGRDNFQEFYDRMGPRLGGFVEIYNLAVEMAKALTAKEAENFDMWEERQGILGAGDWVETVESFVSSLMEEAIRTWEIPDIQTHLEKALALTTTSTKS